MPKKFTIDKRIILIAFVSVFLLVAGQACPRRARVEKEIVREEFYRVGSQGLVMDFAYNQPPSRLYDQDELEIVIEIWNRGAYPPSTMGDVLLGYLYLRGYDPRYINFEEGDWQEIRSLYGRDQYNPEGEYDTITFRDRVIYLPEGIDYYEPLLLATACYEYQTIANPVVCIDPNPYGGQIEDKVCSVYYGGVYGVGLVELTTTQGAPVAVTRVEERIIKRYGSKEAQFRIYVRNIGIGLVVDDDTISYPDRDCPNNLDYTNTDIVEVYAELSGVSLDCSKPLPNQIKLRNGEGFIICYADIEEEVSAYTTPLTITLDYGYMDSISQRVRIVKIPE